MHAPACPAAACRLAQDAHISLAFRTSMPLLHDLIHALLQAIVSHEEHDTVYVKDYACRSFSVATLRAMIEVVLENMPAGRLPSKEQFAVHEASQLPSVSSSNACCAIQISASGYLWAVRFLLPNVYHCQSAFERISLQSLAGFLLVACSQKSRQGLCLTMLKTGMHNMILLKMTRR